MTSYKWQKLGKIFDPTAVKDVAWMKEYAQAPCTLIYDDFVRVYFSCRPSPDVQGQFVSHVGYIDLDRRDLKSVKRLSPSPILPLGDRGTFDEFGTYPFSAIRHGNKVLGYYGGWTRPESVPFDVAIGMAFSKDDGKTFQKVGPGPVIPASMHEPFILSGPKIRQFKDQWMMFYIAGEKWITGEARPEPVYKIRSATSVDGVFWMRNKKGIIDSVLEADECQASPDVIYSGNKYHMFFCYRYSTDYKTKGRGYRIGYAHSFDAVEWHREDAKAGIEPSEEGWDSEMMSYPHVFELDGSIYMMYLGNNFGKEGFGLAKLQGNL